MGRFFMNIDDFIEFLNESPMAYFAVKKAKELLEGAGFERLDLKKDFVIREGGKYFVDNNDSALLAFSVGKLDEIFFKIVGSHTDSPGFRIKAKPYMNKESMSVLNTEVYGGPIINTWLDRPLSFGGRVILKSDDIFNPRKELVKFDKDMLIIPNLAIHMNRQVNDGIKLNPQVHTLPLVGLCDEKIENEDHMKTLLSSELGVGKDDVLDYDLYLYDRQKASLLGENSEFISSGRLDNLASFYTSLKALIDAKDHEGINIIIASDNEEVGSGTKMGADSSFIETVFERILLGLGKGRQDYFKALEKSFMISSDMAHAIHPNYTEKADPINRPKLGKGIVIKYAASKAYASDGESAAILMSICEKAGISYQTFHNRSDMRGGSTIGPITSRRLNVRTVDVGGPMLSMHSVRELMAAKDLYYMQRCFEEFFKI